MPFADDLSPKDHVNLRFTPPSSGELPYTILDPAGHRVNRHLFDFGDGCVAPYYVCFLCANVWRYQECRLPPGEEGIPEGCDALEVLSVPPKTQPPVSSSIKLDASAHIVEAHTEQFIRSWNDPTTGEEQLGEIAISFFPCRDCTVVWRPEECT